jgi:membrane protein DedA with SNARE-associated domain
MRRTLKAIAAPLVILCVSLFLFFTWKSLGLPSDDHLIEIVHGYFERYGLLTVFVSAILEGLLLVGVYYPGSLVIFLGVIFAAGNPLRAAETVIVVIVALCIAYSINFALGKYGWYRLLLAFGLSTPLHSAQARLSKHGPRAIFFTFWHPNIAAVTSTSAGILHIPFMRFALYAGAACIFWNTCWGLVVYTMGASSLQLMGLPFIIALTSLWIVGVLGKRYYDKRRGVTSALVSDDID